MMYLLSLSFLLLGKIAPLLALSTTSMQQISTIKNLRPVGASFCLYRSATLDNLSLDDAQSLLDGSAFGSEKPLAAIIDLRNRDEIRKGEKLRSEGAEYFYSNLISDQDTIDSDAARLLHIPILKDVDAFWDEAIDRMDAGERIAATFQTAFKGGALDRAAARNLEKGGPASLYTVMAETAKRPIGSALSACLRESQRGPVIFHCQKGKDRTGVLAMLLQSCMGDSEQDIIEAYGLSGELLAGEEDSSNARETASDTSPSSGGGMIDWSHFRGSPREAIVNTMAWIRQRYGSIDGYLDEVLFGEEQRMTLRHEISKASKQSP